MAKVVNVSPMTRIEGHLDIEVEIEQLNGQWRVIDARCAGVMFRGFETILAGRDPRDATHYTQRICGVCPVSHAMAASVAMEDAFDVVAPDNGRLLRNLVLGANFIQSHVLHFYHLSAPDYVDTSGVLDRSPWIPRHTAEDMIGGDDAATIIGHYIQALEIRRKAHQMGAIFGGRLPGACNFVPGGSTCQFDRQQIDEFAALLTEIRRFIDEVYVPDVRALAGHFTAFTQLGQGPRNLLAYGVFDLDAAGANRLLGRGRYEGETDSYHDVDTLKIKEYVTHSWFTPVCGDRHPSEGVTEPDADKQGAYSFIKAPRYDGAVYELGPLARMWVNGDYRNGISAIHRIEARALEAKKIADAMVGWLGQLQVGQAVYAHAATPTAATGTGLTEAPRGALGHWLGIEEGKIAHYQVITPTAWNASPTDGLEQFGAIEDALLQTPVRDSENPVELMRIVHSFDPCLACAVHMARPGQRARRIAAAD